MADGQVVEGNSNVVSAFWGYGSRAMEKLIDTGFLEQTSV
jgi:hypothetical protein